MSKIQVSILSSAEATAKLAESDGRFGVRPQGRAADQLIERIDQLEGVWDTVIQKLTDLASKSQAQVATAASKYELKSIEFHVGIEAGLNIGLVTKGDASVSVTFELKEGQTGQPSGNAGS